MKRKENRRARRRKRKEEGGEGRAKISKGWFLNPDAHLCGGPLPVNSNISTDFYKTYKPCTYQLFPQKFQSDFQQSASIIPYTVEPCYNEVLGTMKITSLQVYQVSHYIRVKKTKKYKELGPAKLPCYKGVLLHTCISDLK